MKAHLPVAVSIALALAMPAFAQETAQQPPAPTSGDQQPPSSDSQPTTTGNQDQARPRRARHRQATQPTQRYSSAAMALTGEDRKTADYQASDRQKTYPAVDHGHIPSDPPVIDHSDDRMAVANPTTATITIPPARL